MAEKAPGRNDPCPCGSGKKYKQCCLLSKGGSGVKRKLKAVWINNAAPKPPQHVDLMERTFGNAVKGAEKPLLFLTPPSPKQETESSTETPKSREENPQENSENS